MDMRTTNELIAEYLAKGGKITQCPPGNALNPFKADVVAQPMVQEKDD